MPDHTVPIGPSQPHDARFPASTHQIDQSAADHLIEQAHAELNSQIAIAYAAQPLHGVSSDLVFDFLKDRVSTSFVSGIKNLVSSAENEGYEVVLQFFRSIDRSETAPVVVILQRVGVDGHPVFAAPNVTAILSRPEERLRGDISSSGQKLTRATDGVASEGEDATFGERVSFEEFNHPARLVVTPSVDPERHRPFELALQLSPKAASEAEKHLAEAIDHGEGAPFSFLLECVVHPFLTEILARYSALFGVRERADIISGKITAQNHHAELEVRDPEAPDYSTITFDVTLGYNPTAAASSVSPFAK